MKKKIVLQKNTCQLETNRLSVDINRSLMHIESHCQMIKLKPANDDEHDLMPKSNLKLASPVGLSGVKGKELINAYFIF